jgi:hypothetical protein
MEEDDDGIRVDAPADEAVMVTGIVTVQADDALWPVNCLYSKGLSDRSTSLNG